MTQADPIGIRSILAEGDPTATQDLPLTEATFSPAKVCKLAGHFFGAPHARQTQAQSRQTAQEMNHEAPESVQRSNYLLGIDRFNIYGVEARHMPYPYLWCRKAKTAYMSGYKVAFERSEDPDGRGER